MRNLGVAEPGGGRRRHSDLRVEARAAAKIRYVADGEFDLFPRRLRYSWLLRHGLIGKPGVTWLCSAGSRKRGLAL